MDDIIEALGIFKKYVGDYGRNYPFQCEHDILLTNCDKENIPDDDSKRLKELGFYWSEEYCCWISFRFGSY